MEMRPNCEACNIDLPQDSKIAVICSFECSFCIDCAATRFHFHCPNCGGELVSRPARPSAKVKSIQAEAVYNKNHQMQYPKMERNIRPNVTKFGQNLFGLGINLLVKDIAKAVEFFEQVAGGKVYYQDEFFAYGILSSLKICYHHDSTYRHHPLIGLVRAINENARGAGLEIRSYDSDPDKAQSIAESLDYIIYQPSSDKPHGMRECYISDADGYCWVFSKTI